MDQEFFAGLAKNVSDGPTPFVNMAQLQAEAVEERHVRLRLPVAERHLNHVGIAYAGSEFVLAEIAGGTLFMATYGTDEFVPIWRYRCSTWTASRLRRWTSTTTRFPLRNNLRPHGPCAPAGAPSKEETRV